jgi:hypothetical protein
VGRPEKTKQSAETCYLPELASGGKHVHIRYTLRTLCTLSINFNHRMTYVGASWAEAGQGRHMTPKSGGARRQSRHLRISVRVRCQQCLFRSSKLPSFLSSVGLIINAITRCFFQSNTIQLNCKDGSAGIPPIRNLQLLGSSRETVAAKSIRVEM